MMIWGVIGTFLGSFISRCCICMYIANSVQKLYVIHYIYIYFAWILFVCWCASNVSIPWPVHAKTMQLSTTTTSKRLLWIAHTRTLAPHTHTHTIWMSKRKKKGECYFWIYRYSQPTQCYSKIFVLFPKVHSSFPLILSLPYLWCLSSVATEEFIKNYFPFILSFNYYPLVLMCACEFCLPICIC